MLDLRQHYSQFTYEDGPVFRWSPATKTITYVSKRLDKPTGYLSLLHEICHGLLEHADYHSDLELVRMEVAAWQETRSIATSLDLQVDEDSIERCLDTYRDWLFARSRCPSCEQTGIQQADQSYRCFMCNDIWKVPARQTCLVKRYRKNTPILPVSL